MDSWYGLVVEELLVLVMDGGVVWWCWLVGGDVRVEELAALGKLLEARRSP